MTRASLLVLCAMAAIGQDCRSLNGTWRMVPERSFFAGIKDPAEQAEDETLVILQDGAKIEERWKFEGTRLHGQVAYTYIVDGTEHIVSKDPQSPSSVRAEWQNCTLIVDKKMPFLGGLKFDVRNTYVLSHEGKQLTILQEAHSKVADVERRLVFEKQ